MPAEEGNPKKDADTSSLKRLMSQLLEDRANRNYSKGRISPEDDGDLAMAVGLDTAKNIVIIDFGKPVAWIGLDKETLAGLIASLTEKMKGLK